MRVRDYMTKNVVTVEPDVRLTEVVSIMESNDFHRVPVVDVNNVYQGLITEAIIANNSPALVNILHIKILYIYFYIFRRKSQYKSEKSLYK